LPSKVIVGRIISGACQAALGLACTKPGSGYGDDVPNLIEHLVKLQDDDILEAMAEQLEAPSLPSGEALRVRVADYDQSPRVEHPHCPLVRIAGQR
jgi:hypothetical protein